MRAQTHPLAAPCAAHPYRQTKHPERQHHMTDTQHSNRRHNRNPFAIAHAIQSTQAQQFLSSDTPTDEEATDLAALRLYHCYQQLREETPMSPKEFQRRLYDDLDHYPVLLATLDHITPYSLPKRFAEYDQATHAQSALSDIAERFHLYDPPAPPPTSAELAKAEVGLTTNQRNYRRRRNRSHLALGTRPFFDIFGTPLLTELFIAAHRWPNANATCPTCGSSRTKVFQFDIPDEEPDPNILSRRESGPAIGWDCFSCDQVFISITGTIMTEPNLPPPNWLFFANIMLICRSDIYELDLPNAVATHDGIEVTQHEAETMRDKIRSVLPFAKPYTRQTVSGLDAMKMMARGSTT